MSAFPIPAAFLSPQELRSALPLSFLQREFLQQTQEEIKNIFEKKDPRMLLIVGPCSLHDEKAFWEYAVWLKKLSLTLKHFLPVIRCFYEKPRTYNSWKGFLSDPFLDGSFQMETGLKKTRKLMLDLIDLKLPLASELLNPFSVPYFQDLISYGTIGARTCASQIHRQIASFVPFPIGFKNPLSGDLETALNSALTARETQAFLYLGQDGRITQVKSPGNPWAHLVLRGSWKSPNYSQAPALSSRLQAEDQLLPLIIDCAHGNSGKTAAGQKEAFRSLILKTKTEGSFFSGLMLESFLKTGRQAFRSPPSRYGVSITDPCLGCEETSGLLSWAESTLSSVSLSMSIR
ncbi:MAG: 3-deoxy-7-phosphoheptulonate synthase [Parachlamydiales bacterium]|jgi:3-deoxy-7-phosphoheptulonate synthase